jgi:hypothetical protein
MPPATETQGGPLSLAEIMAGGAKKRKQAKAPERMGTAPRPLAEIMAGSTSKKKLTDAEKLPAEIEQLEGLSAEYGAGTPEQDKPGAIRIILDLLSRPNYAVAGIAETMLDEAPSVSKGAKRALTEIFSGAFGLEGEKRAFGEVLERQGVDTFTLADAMPALEGTWIGKWGSRGAAGLALDILTDPTTYLTGGAARGALLIGTKKGSVALSKKGLQEFSTILKGTEVADEITKLGAKADPYRLGVSGIEMKKAEIAEQLFTRKFGDNLPVELVDPGGLKFMGQTVVRGEKFDDAGAALGSAIKMLPGGAYSLGKAAQLGEGMKRGINEMFGSFGQLGSLPPELRHDAILLHRNFNRASAAHRQRLRGILDHGNEQLGVAPDLAQRYIKAQKADPELGRKLYELREGTAQHALGPEQQQIFDEFVKLHDSLGRDLVETGVFEPDEILKNYFHHKYTPESLKGLDQYHAEIGTKFSGAIKETITKERPFRTFKEAEQISAELNRIGRQSLDAKNMVGLYPVLVPEYDLLKNFNKYIDQYADSISRKAWHEEAAARFTIPVVEKFDKNLHYAAVTGRGLIPAEADTVRKVLGDGRPDLAAAENAMKGLSEDGRYELVGQMLEKAESATGAAGALAWARDRWAKYLPNLKPDVPHDLTDGDLYAKLFGNAARPVKRSGAIWGDREVMVPELIAKDIEAVNSRILNTKDYGAFKKLIDGYDRANNLFKWGVYTIWPASAVRNAYSNVAQSFLDIGVGALDPKRHFETVAIMAKRDLDAVSVGGYTRRDLRKMAQDFGVTPSGETFVETTGRTRLGKVATKTARFTGSIENEARMQLWLGNIARGIHPRQAADHVAEFLFDYGELSQFEKTFMKRMIPFYTWTRKNIALQVRTLRRNPGMQVNQLKPFRGRDNENEQMVQWEAEALKLRMDRDGKTIRVITGIDLPLRNLDTLWRGDLKRTGRGLMGMVTPLVKTWPELLLNHDFFLGKDMTRVESGAVGRLIEKLPTPPAVRDWLGYKKTTDDAGRPRYSFRGDRFTLLFRSWMLSRALSTSDRQFREYVTNGGTDWQAAALDVLTGLRAKELNLDEQMQRRLEERRRQLQSALVRRGVLVNKVIPFAPKKGGAEF